MEFFTVLAVGVVLLIFLWWVIPGDPLLPPCPSRPLPFVGHLLSMSSDSRAQFKKWREQCGDVFRFRLGWSNIVVLNGYDVIHEALVKKKEVFLDRPRMFFDQATGYPGKGVVFSAGEEWEEQRAVTLTILRSLGMGKNILADKIQEEVDKYSDFLSSLQGKPVDIQHQTTLSIANITCSIIIGKRFDYDDEDFKNLMEQMHVMSLALQDASLLNFMPWLQHLPGDLFKAKKIFSNFESVLESLKNFMKEKNSEKVNSFHDNEKFINSYTTEMSRKIKSGKKTFMSKDNLAKIILELFNAGTHTTSMGIYWLVLYVVNYPDVQEKVYNEIKDVVGRNRKPTIEDKPQLIYLNALIMEVQRLVSLAPLALPHVCSKDATLRGYKIPKGTIVIPNLDSVHHDKVAWGEDVMAFKPERFIDDSGALMIPKEFIPFSTGPRVCLGESLAKMELFLFSSSLFQRFQFLSPDPASPPPTDYIYSFVVSPKSYQVIVKERENMTL